jgi:hypothetical protein
MNSVKNKGRLAGILFLLAMLVGIFSVAPAVDGANYLTEAAANPNQVIIATLCQFMMGLAYMGIAMLFYSTLKTFGGSLSIGFLSMRIIAATLVMVGTILLPSLLVLSQKFVENPSQSPLPFEVLGHTLKATRDHINHVFMILTLCIGNLMLYVLLLKSRLIPRWLSVCGLLGNALSAIASLLVLFQAVDIITPEYLSLNALTAVQELILGVWLIVKGFDKRLLETRA